MQGAGKGFHYYYDRTASGGNAVGTVGAVYRLHASGLLNETNGKVVTAPTPFSADLVLESKQGLMLEGTNYGDAYLAMQPRGSWEFGFPSLKIKSGSFSYNGTEIKLVGGNIWNDLQTVQPPPGGELIPNRGIYLGTWSSITLDNGIIMQAWSLWEDQDEPGQQWISGTMVGRPPRYVAGTLFYPVDKITNGSQGGAPVWGTEDFDLNILNPKNPQSSPHYTSPISNQTYALAWQLTINRAKLGSFATGIPRTLYMFPIMRTGQAIPEMHMLGTGLPSYFYEMSCVVYKDKERKNPIGRGFVEQMGFN